MGYFLLKIYAVAVWRCGRCRAGLNIASSAWLNINLGGNRCANDWFILLFFVVRLLRKPLAAACCHISSFYITDRASEIFIFFVVRLLRKPLLPYIEFLHHRSGIRNFHPGATNICWSSNVPPNIKYDASLSTIRNSIHHTGNAKYDFFF